MPEVIITVLYYITTDIDECAGGLANCHENAKCINSVGNVSCFCNPGFAGDGFNCIRMLYIIIILRYLLV